MKLLLGSGGCRTEQRIDRLCQQMRQHFGEIEKILFLPYALADHDRYVEMLNGRVLNAGYILDGIHHHRDPVKAVESAEGIYVGGGNTFRLLATLYRHQLLDPIRERVQNGLPYLGVSAGTNVACPTIQTTNDMPITMPPSFEALGLFPFQINPHYFDGHTFVKQDEKYHEHFGETRDERISEFHEMNETPVIGLWEGGILKVVDEKVQLIGTSARVFHRGRDPYDLADGSQLSLDEIRRGSST